MLSFGVKTRPLPEPKQEPVKGRIPGPIHPLVEEEDEPVNPLLPYSELGLDSATSYDPDLRNSILSTNGVGGRTGSSSDGSEGETSIQTSTAVSRKKGLSKSLLVRTVPELNQVVRWYRFRPGSFIYGLLNPHLRPPVSTSENSVCGCQVRRGPKGRKGGRKESPGRRV